MKKILTLVLALALSAALLVGCAGQIQLSPEPHVHPEQTAEIHGATGILNLKINPEIALHYDETGKVTKLEGRNADGVRILENVNGYEGKDTALVLTELVEEIGKAGYFVEEADGTARRIVLELDPGSQVPHEQFLQDMAKHVQTCVENKNWAGEKEFEYSEKKSAPAAESPATEATVPATTKPAESKPTKAAVTLCPVCGDDDCDDGKYCDDADEKAENLREQEAKKAAAEKKEKKATEPTVPATTEAAKPKETKPAAKVCEICGDDDCDDGKYCDDADEKAENLREQETKQAAAKKEKQTEPTVPATTKPAESKTTKAAVTLCPVCGDDDCDDGKYCDDADEKAENLREQEAKKAAAEKKEKKATELTVPATTKPVESKTTKPAVTLCPVCGDDDCDDGKYCDDADEKAENLREQENKKNNTPCKVCGDYDCDDGDACDDWDERFEHDEDHEDKRHNDRHHDDDDEEDDD